MDVATAWIGNNILSVDFDHFFEYSLDKINMQYIYLSSGYMYTDIVFVNPFSIVQSMFICLDYILS